MPQNDMSLDPSAARILAGNSIAAVAGKISPAEAADYIVGMVHSLELLAAAKNLPSLQGLLADCRREAERHAEELVSSRTRRRSVKSA